MSTAETESGGRPDRRTKVVDVATRLFLENGYAGTSMSAVAKECGLTKATLYHHFPSKEDLFVACVTDGYGQALRVGEQIVENPSVSPAEKMRQLLEMLYQTIIFSSVGRMSPLIAEVSRKFPQVAQSFHGDYVTPQQNLITRLLDEGQASGDFAKVDRKVFNHLAVGPIVTLSLSREMFATFDDLDEEFPISALQRGHIDVMLSMLKKRSA